MITNDKFWENLDDYRVMYCGGPPGTGKTLLSVAIAFDLFRGRHYGHEYRVWSNIDLTFSTPVEPDLPYQTVILLDEARRYMDARTWSKNSDSLLDYLRHLDTFILMPAVFNVDKRARRFQIRRAKFRLPFPLLKGVEFNIRDAFWLYAAQVEQREGFLFTLYGPSAYWSMYRTHNIIDGGDVIYWLLDDIMEGLKPDREAQKRKAREILAGFDSKERARELGLISDSEGVVSFGDSD